MTVSHLLNSRRWLPSLISSLSRRPKMDAGNTHLYFCLVDHFEPAWHGADLPLQQQRVQHWVERYPSIAARHHDSDGRPPQHTFFFPAEEYAPPHLDALAKLRQAGWGDVEVHLHHDRDTPAGLYEKLVSFCDILHNRHGLLRKDDRGRIRYGFIHGNWALNNSAPDGRWCGVDDETSILLDTGCYADFTMPCAPHPAQSQKVNSIYYAIPQDEPRGHDTGIEARVGSTSPGGLLMVQGPLTINRCSRKWGMIPRIESADVSAYNPPTPDRVRLWINTHVHVQGAPNHIFVKASTHGAQENNTAVLLSAGLKTIWSGLEALSEGRRFFLHYVTAHEMFLKISGLEAGIYEPDSSQPLVRQG